MSVVVHPCHLSTRGLRQENHELIPLFSKTNKQRKQNSPICDILHKSNMLRTKLAKEVKAVFTEN
jgi:hypothetical protein